MISSTEFAVDSLEPEPGSPAAPLGLMRLALLASWGAASFGTCYFARDLQMYLGPRLQAYGLAAQGILIVFIVLVLFNAWYFNRRTMQRKTQAEHEADGGV